ncbi:hypothetical protein A7X67_00080 [Clostridium sp. W14A]|uniref:Flagellar export protein FliJ n=1 Tax=Caproicibacter fermentans TaxID=2576756 RepID=A0A7G8TAX2_9FIRM|nr:hypothetical protein [Caproicibacter fermentans]OCN00892.1 hypothetical protein A7X67_00080 [Clostridium sp. W14A]QNK40763.1 flagellar export protein FliJ [Caproicibacter fermentans]
MPRGRKKATPENLEQQISGLDAEIESYQQKIQEAKRKKKELIEQKKKQDMEKLFSMIQESGKTVEEVIQSFQNQ